MFASLRFLIIVELLDFQELARVRRAGQGRVGRDPRAGAARAAGGRVCVAGAARTLNGSRFSALTTARGRSGGAARAPTLKTSGRPQAAYKGAL